jgi:hypothetical protein
MTKLGYGPDRRGLRDVSAFQTAGPDRVGLRTNLRLFLELMTVALLLSACRIVVDTKVNPDGSGELRTAVVYTAEEAEGFTQTPGNESKSICENLKNDVPLEATFTEEVHDGETHCVTTRSFTNLRELRTLYAGMGNVTVNELERGLTNFVFDVDVDLTEAQEGEGVASEWRLTLPGTVGEHNADRVEGQTLIWDAASGERTNLHAESAVGPDLARLGLVLACACSLVVVSLAGVFLLLRRRRPARA